MRATYRLQLGPDLDFAGAAALVPYLRELGVSHLYLSPSFEARPGSTHGYDVVDPRRLSGALGGEEASGRWRPRRARPAWGSCSTSCPTTWPRVPARRSTGSFDRDPETGFVRRFFDIDDLLGVRQEDPEVFAATNELALRLVAEGLVDGLRVDHPDGLADPAGYLQRLRDGGAERVWVEKIVEHGEALRDWPVCGTTGYEFLNDVLGLFVDPAAEAAFATQRPFAQVADEAKREQAQTTFLPRGRLARTAVARGPRRHHGVAVRAAHLPHLRRVGGGPRRAARRRRGVGARRPRGLPDALAADDAAGDGQGRRGHGLLPPRGAAGTQRGRRRPGRFGVSVAEFHRANALRAQRWPLAMTTLQTHDTKRSADVRARLAALTWIAGEWTALEDAVLPSAPDRDEGRFFLQTVVAAPVAEERLRAYIEKALRERKLSSSWADPDVEHERRMGNWVAGLLMRDDVRAFAARLAAVAEPIVLGQKLLQLTSPGVPDVYQGDEDGFVALVDPDNRRPVDWGALRASTSAKARLTARRSPAAGGVALTTRLWRRRTWSPTCTGAASRRSRSGRARGSPDPPGSGWAERFAAPGVALYERE